MKYSPKITCMYNSKIPNESSENLTKGWSPHSEKYFDLKFQDHNLLLYIVYQEFTMKNQTMVEII